MKEFCVVLVALYRNRNFPVRIMHSLLKNLEGVRVHTIFFKNSETDNTFKPHTKKEEKLFIKLINDLNPQLVGFSVLSPFFLVAKRLSNLVKDNTASSVIWGGIHPTISPETCISEADMLCIGEGEGAIVELIRKMQEKGDYRNINNLWLRNNGSLIKNPMRPLMENLDSLPYPSYGDDSFFFIDQNEVERVDPLLSDNCFWVQASRGCPYVCSFCVNSILREHYKGLGNYIRKKSVDNVINEIKLNLNLPGSKVNYVFFVDEAFGKDHAWTDEFEQKYKKEIGLPFFVETNPREINDAMIKKLTNAGLDTIGFGIQSGTDYIRNNIFQRPGKNKEIIQLINNITQAGKKVTCELILNNPYDDVQSLKDSIEFLLQLPEPFSFTLYSLQYFPNYPLTVRAIKDNHIGLQDASLDGLIKKATKNWYFVPRLFPYTQKQILQNIIWLLVNNFTKKSIVRGACLEKTFYSKVLLVYLNFKAVIFGKIFAVGGLATRSRVCSYVIRSSQYLSSGDYKGLFIKVKKRLSKNRLSKISSQL